MIIITAKEGCCVSPFAVIEGSGNMTKGERLLFLAGILLAIGALAFSAWKLRGIYGEYQKGEDTYEELASFVEEPG